MYSDRFYNRIYDRFCDRISDRFYDPIIIYTIFLIILLFLLSTINHFNEILAKVQHRRLEPKTPQQLEKAYSHQTKTTSNFSIMLRLLL